MSTGEPDTCTAVRLRYKDTDGNSVDVTDDKGFIIIFNNRNDAQAYIDANQTPARTYTMQMAFALGGAIA